MRNFKYIVVLCFLLLSQWIAAGTVLQSEDENWIGKVPKFHRTEGNDFWLAFMNIGAFDPDQPTEEGEEGEGDEDIKQTLKLNVVVTARERMTIFVQAGTYSRSFSVNANQTYVLSLPTQSTYYLNQYYLSQSEEEPIGDQKRKQGVHVYAAENDKDKVFSCYLYARLGNSGNTLRDASLVYPTKFLGKEYMIQTYPEDIAATEFAIVATEDDTQVRIKPSVTTAGGHSSSFSVKLKKGEAYLVASQSVELGATDVVNLSGTTICSNNPIAVFSGNQKAMIPYQEGYTEDFMVEQALPVSQWGTEFYISLMEQTRENHALITALENGTVLTVKSYNSQTREVESSDINLSAGQTTPYIQMYDELYTERYITSTKPVLCNTFMTSAAANLFTTIDPLSGKVDSLYGDPASAMVPAWELRTDTMTLFRTDLDPLNPNKTPQYLFAYVVVKKDDIDKMSVKMPSAWISVDASLFKTFKVNPDMAYAYIPLYKGTMTDAPEAYTLAMNGGEGFVGTAYAITIGQSYDYTLGFQPHEYPDSLYVTYIDGGKMSPKSYDMEPLDNKGWYQRQLTEWKRARRHRNCLLCSRC